MPGDDETGGAIEEGACVDGEEEFVSGDEAT